MDFREKPTRSDFCSEENAEVGWLFVPQIVYLERSLKLDVVWKESFTRTCH
jgi:hypothetical protein